MNELYFVFTDGSHLGTKGIQERVSGIGIVIVKLKGGEIQIVDNYGLPVKGLENSPHEIELYAAYTGVSRFIEQHPVMPIKLLTDSEFVYKRFTQPDADTTGFHALCMATRKLLDSASHFEGVELVNGKVSTCDTIPEDDLLLVKWIAHTCSVRARKTEKPSKVKQREYSRLPYILGE